MSSETIRFKNRYKAQDAVCEAFVILGTLAGVDAASGKGPADLDKALISACQESFYSDPHFLGGPACFHYAKTTANVERIFNSAFDVSERLYQYIERQGDLAKIKAAEESIAVIDSAHVWLNRTIMA